MRDENRKRTSYLHYLQQSRLTLLQLKSCLRKLATRLHREEDLTTECLVEVLVRFYLERSEQFVRNFIIDFQHLVVQVGCLYLGMQLCLVNIVAGRKDRYGG